MAQQAQHSAIARYIEPARRSRDDVMTFEAFFAAAALTPPAITTQDVRPQTCRHRRVEPLRGR